MSDIGKNITVADLAREAGVSPATVSRVLNHSHLVNQQTYDKVMRAIHRLGYEIPSPKKGKKNVLCKRIVSNVIAVNVSTYSDGAYAEFLKGIHVSAYRYDWSPVVTQQPITSPESAEEYIKLLHQIRAAGVIFLNHVEVGLLEQISAEFPAIQCGEYDPACSLPYVGVNDYEASRAMVTHLIAGGARKIAFVNGPSHFRYARERRRGYEAALASAGISLDPLYIIELSEVSYTMAHAFLTSMLVFKNHPDAIFAANDVIAYAAVVAAKEHGLSVPEDISIAGFGNMGISSVSIPKITTVSQPDFQMGFVGCELLRERWNNQPSTTQSILLSTELIIRGSTR